MKRKVIFDTDPGIDDAIALLTLLNSDMFDVLGITTVAGNKGIEHTTTNASKIVTYMNQSIPIYQGAYSRYPVVKENKPSDHLDGGDVHGKDGLGGVDLKVDPELFKKESAVDFLVRCALEFPNEVEIISVGPMSNLALAIEQDEAAMRQIKKIWSMGGGVRRGNVTPVAEFNYWFDPDAVEKVYSIGDEVPIVMIGLDATHQCIFDMNDLTFMKLACGPKGEMMAHMVNDYVKAYWTVNGYIGVVIHDLIAVLAAMDEDICTTLTHTHLDIVMGGKAHGQCLVDLVDSWKKPKNAYVCMDLDVRKCKEMFFETCFTKEVMERYREVFP